MVYRKFVNKGGKTFGPYYYESYREGNEVKKIYIGGEKEYQEWRKKNDRNPKTFVEQSKKFNKKLLLAFGLVFFIFIFLLFAYNLNLRNSNSSLEEKNIFSIQLPNYNSLSKLIGFAISEEPINETTETLPEEIELIIEQPEISEENITEIQNETTSLVEEQINETISAENETIEIPFQEQNISEIPVENLTEINITEINETIIIENEEGFNLTTEKYRIVIGRPVKWVKKIEIQNNSIEELKIELPKQAENISIKTGDEAQQALNEINTETSSGITGAVIWDSNNKFSKNLENLFSNIADLFKGKSITGNAISENEIEITETENSKIVNVGNSVDITQETQIAVEYFTEAPQSAEENTSIGKKIIISGPDDVHYTDILAYTEIQKQVPETAIKLYHIVNDSKENVEIGKYDLNSDGFIDYIEWNLPHLSEQEYELEIVILNVQSYPTVEGNWTVNFTTIGTANLTITAFDETTWSNNSEESSLYDLKFLELKCNEDILDYQWIETEGNFSIFIENYSCNGTGYETSKVLKEGAHYLEFDFGRIKATAQNWAENGSLVQYVDNCGTLATQDSTYVMNVSIINSTGTCFTITAPNITLDCAGHTINYSIAGTSSAYGIYSNQQNTTILNCTIIDGNVSASDGPNTERHAIYLKAANFGNITNNNVSIYGATSYGFYIYSSNYTTLNSNSVFSNASYGIRIESSSYNNLTSNNGTSNAEQGIRIETSSYNNLFNNLGMSNASYGIRVYYLSNYNNITSNTGISNSIQAFYLGIAHNNNLTSNIGTSNSSQGIRLDASVNNTLINNIGISNGSYGIYLYTSNYSTLILNNGTCNLNNIGFYLYLSWNNNLTSNIGTSNSSYGLVLESSSNNTLTSNAGISNSSYGIAFSKALTNNVTSNTGISNSNNGIYIYKSNDSIFNSNTAYSNINWAFYSNFSFNNNFTLNNGTSNSSQGIRIEFSSNNNITSNNGTSNFGIGFYMPRLNNSIITSNIGTSKNASTGFYLAYSSNDNVTSNLGTSNSSYGIYVYSSNYTNITSNIGMSNTSEGILFDSSFYNNLNSNNGSSISDYGIWFFKASNSNVTSNIGTSNSSNGIYIFKSNESMFNSNTAYSNINWAFYSNNSFYNNFTLNNGTSNSSQGIRIEFSSNNNLTSNIGTSNSSLGIYLLRLNDSNLNSNIGVSNSSQGIYIYLSENNNLTSNIGASNGSFGIVNYYSNKNNFTLNTGISNYSHGIYLYSSNYTVLTLNNGSSLNGSGIILESSLNNTLNSNNGISNSSYGIYLSLSLNNSLISNFGMSNGSYGIYNYLSNYNILMFNNGTSDSGAGIRIETSSNNNLTLNSVSSDAGQGIYVYLSNNSILTSNNATSNASYGIIIDSSLNNNLTLNTGISNASYGIYIYSSNNNTLTSNTAVSNDSAIYLYYSDNNNLTLNNGTTNSGRGIYVRLSDYNILTSNIGIAGSRVGFFIEFSNYNNLTSNTGIADSGAGLQLYSSEYNNLTSNIGMSNSSYGIRLSTSANNNNLTFNTGISNSSVGIYLLRSRNNTLIGNNATGFLTGSYGLYIQNESETLIKDCIDVHGASWDVHVDDEAGTNVTILNCSYDLSKEDVDGAGNNLTRKWYYRAYVNDSLTGLPIYIANVTAFNSSDDYNFNLTTDATGYTPITTIYDYINLGGTRDYYSNYTIYYTNESYPTAAKSYNVTASQNNLEHVLSFENVAPVVRLISPAEEYSSTSTTTDFVFNVSDNSETNCTMYVNGISYSFNNSVNISGGENKFQNDIAVGTYTWSVNCTDIFNNIGNSSQRTFTITSVPVTPTTTPSGGGGGITPAPKIIEENLVISDKILEIPIVINTVKTREIELSNNGDKEINVSLNAEGLKDMIILSESSFKLASHEKKTINIKIVGPEKPGIYTGKIKVNNQEILVSISASTKELLFDVGIVIPDEFKSINVGDELSSQITLIPMGEKPRLDTTLNYIIKDFDGKVYLTESETLLIDGQKTFKKTFATQNLPIGNYILGLELIYPNGVAVSTSHFEVKTIEKKVSDYGLILYFLAGSILLLIIGIILLIKKYKKIKRFKIRRKRG